MTISSKWPRDSNVTTVLAANENSTVTVRGCREVKWKTNFCRLFYVLSFGFLWVLFYWKPTWRILITCEPCQLSNATLVLIKNEDHEWFIRRIYVEKRSAGLTVLKPGGLAAVLKSYRYFTHRKVLYVWYDDLNVFHRVFNLDNQVPCNNMHEHQPLQSPDALSRCAAYGSNEITVELKPIWRLFLLEVTNPFYFFQVISVCIWFWEAYDAYAVVVIVITSLSIAVNVYQVRRNQRALRDTIASSGNVSVIRDNDIISANSTCLVPGDIIVIPARGYTMQCDAVLLTGTCIVNESMLTGESVPVTKTPLPTFTSELEDTADSQSLYNDKHHSKHTLYNGTKVLQTRHYADRRVVALVIRTGFNTTKGQLVRSIMYPKQVDFEFTKDLLRFIAIMGIFALIGFVYSIVVLVLQGAGLTKAVIDACDVLTILVPPALPAAMTMGIIAAQGRLKQQRVYCISPNTINTCGGIDAVCFDKTGTLTEDGLSLLGIVKSNRNLMESEIRNPRELDSNDDVIQAMACCHSLTFVDNVLTGEPLDIILFEETNWELEESQENARKCGKDFFDSNAMTIVRSTRNDQNLVEIGVLKQFTFSSNLQRMSVVTKIRGTDNNFVLFCKGAPETVSNLCEPNSVPKNFRNVLKTYTKKGYRVLAVANRILSMDFDEMENSQRERLESKLNFLGLLIMENRLKEETSVNISILHYAQIRTVMVTGDNVLTAISVARNCGIVDDSRPLYTVEIDSTTQDIKILDENDTFNEKLFETSSKSFEMEMVNNKQFNASYQLAVSGITFAAFFKHYPTMVPRLVAACNVFARMAPEQKGQLVTAMQDLGYIVAMCGDGANDCGALKAAHAGISLSEAEASIASPFTSTVPNISCVPTVIREGRAALVTSFGVFKYMVAYSFVQFISVSILFSINTRLSNVQFLYSDFFLTTIMALFFGYTPAAEVLVAQKPPTRVLTVSSVISILTHLAIVLGFQMFAFLFITYQPWFIPYVSPGDLNNYYSYQGTIVFCTSIFQYLTMAVLYSKSAPYRKPIYTNRYFSISLLLLTACSLWCIIYPPKFAVVMLRLKMAPFVKYRLLVIVLSVVNFFISYLIERYIAEWLLFEVAERKGWFKRSKLPKFVTIMPDIATSPKWLLEKIQTKKIHEDKNGKNNYENVHVVDERNSKSRKYN